jgi:hypothetical protein
MNSFDEAPSTSICGGILRCIAELYHGNVRVPPLLHHWTSGVVQQAQLRQDLCKVRANGGAVGSGPIRRNTSLAVGTEGRPRDPDKKHPVHPTAIYHRYLNFSSDMML